MNASPDPSSAAYLEPHDGGLSSFTATIAAADDGVLERVEAFTRDDIERWQAWLDTDGPQLLAFELSKLSRAQNQMLIDSSQQMLVIIVAKRIRREALCASQLASAALTQQCTATDDRNLVAHGDEQRGWMHA